MNAKERLLSSIAGKTILPGFLATLTLERGPTVRPVTFLIDGASLYFTTFKNSDKAAQLAADPRVEVTIPFKDDRGNGYFRVRGKARAITDPAEKEEVTRKAGFDVTVHYDRIDDPKFLIFAIDADRERFMEPGEFGEVDVSWLAR